MAGKKDMLPQTQSELKLETHVLERAVGTKELMKIEKINTNESLLLHLGAAITVGKVTGMAKDSVTLQLTRPVCAQQGARVAISRKIGGRWRLIGYGMIK
jgi:translation initiation factor 2 subunit 3